MWFKYITDASSLNGNYEIQYINLCHVLLGLTVVDDQTNKLKVIIKLTFRTDYFYYYHLMRLLNGMER